MGMQMIGDPAPTLGKHWYASHQNKLDCTPKQEINICEYGFIFLLPAQSLKVIVVAADRHQATALEHHNKAASTRSVSDGSHSLNTTKYGHKAALFLSPALFHESLTSVG